MLSLDPPDGWQNLDNTSISLSWPKILAIPGVRAASFGDAQRPNNGMTQVSAPMRRSKSRQPSENAPRFRDARLPLLRGRDFSWRQQQASRVAIIGQSLARHFFPHW